MEREKCICCNQFSRSLSSRGSINNERSAGRRKLAGPSRWIRGNGIALAVSHKQHEGRWIEEETGVSLHCRIARSGPRLYISLYRSFFSQHWLLPPSLLDMRSHANREELRRIEAHLFPTFFLYLQWPTSYPCRPSGSTLVLVASRKKWPGIRIESPPPPLHTKELLRHGPMRDIRRWQRQLRSGATRKKNVEREVEGKGNCVLCWFVCCVTYCYITLPEFRDWKPLNVIPIEAFRKRKSEYYIILRAPYGSRVK